MGIGAINFLGMSTVVSQVANMQNTKLNLAMKANKLRRGQCPEAFRREDEQQRLGFKAWHSSVGVRLRASRKLGSMSTEGRDRTVHSERLRNNNALQNTHTQREGPQ